MSDPEIRFCPSCGNDSLRACDVKAFKCDHCSFLYYHNVAATCSAIVEVEDEILLVRRAREPGKGLLDFPGGFIEKNERAEVALLRELKEELGIDLNDSGHYFCNQVNSYPYASIEYNTLDMYFHIKLKTKPELNVNDDVDGYQWCKPGSVNFEHIAFSSVKNAITEFIQCSKSD